MNPNTRNTRYEVAIHQHGRKRVQRGPAEGLLDWPRHVWTRITRRPLGLARAKALADEQNTHATVQVWMTSEVVYQNGKPPTVPEGWVAPEGTQ